MIPSDRLTHEVTMWTYFLYLIVGLSSLLLSLGMSIRFDEPLTIMFFIFTFGIIMLLVTPFALLLTILRLFWGAERRLLVLFFLTLVLVMPLTPFQLYYIGILQVKYVPSWYTFELTTVVLEFYGVAVSVLFFRYFVREIWRNHNTDHNL